MIISLYYLKPEYEDYFRQSYDQIVNDTGDNPRRDYYKKVFSGEVEDDVDLDALFSSLTNNMPPNFVGHDFGVSDVIGIDTDGKELKAGEFYFCDIIGWDKLTSWMNDEDVEVEEIVEESITEDVSDNAGSSVSYWATSGEFVAYKIPQNKNGEGTHFFTTLKDANDGINKLNKTHLYKINHKPLARPLVIEGDIVDWSAKNIAELLLAKLYDKPYDVWEDGDILITPDQININNLTEDDEPFLLDMSQSEETYQTFNAMFDFIISKGYDSIKYLNTYENAHSWCIAVNPDKIGIKYPLELVSENNHTEGKMKKTKLNISDDSVQEQIKNDIKKAVYAHFKKEGYNEKETNLYYQPYVDTQFYEEYYDDGADALFVEVRAELDYDDLMELASSLNKTIAKLDKWAYFEPVTAGILQSAIAGDAPSNDDAAWHDTADREQADQPDYDPRSEWIESWKKKTTTKRESYDDIDLDRYEEIDSKYVYDSDGFTTEYTLYFDHDENNYFTVFGDRDLYAPEDSEHDMDFGADEDEARDWFDNYEGFVDDDLALTTDDMNAGQWYESVDESKPSKTELRRKGLLPARGKEVSELPRYYVGAFFDRDYRGLEDNLSTDDYSEAEDFAWKYYQRGDFIQFKDQKTGKEVRIDNDNKSPIYADDFFDALIEIKDDAINESADNIPNWFKSLYYEAKEKFPSDYEGDTAEQCKYIYDNTDVHDNTLLKWRLAMKNEYYKKKNEKLIQSSSDKAFKKNVATEIKAGKPQKQALAIAYDVKRKNESVDDDCDKEDWDEAERIYQKHGYAISLLNVLCKWNELSPNAEPDKDFYKPLHNRYYWRELMDLAYDIDQSHGYTGDYLGESKGKGMIDVLGNPNDTNEGLQEITKDFANARKQFDKYGLDIKFDDALELFNKKSKLAEPDTFYAKPLYNKDAFDDLVKIATEECGVEEVKEGIEELDDGWKEVNGRNGYRLFRKIVDGKGKWRAQKCVNGKCEGEPFDITYEQALGREPIEDKPIAELSKKLGKILLPKREGVKESYDDTLYGIAERLVKLYQEYDWYDYNDSLEIGETEEDAIEKELAYLQSVGGIKRTLKGLEELDMEWNDSGMGVKAERDRLVVDLKELLKDYSKNESTEKPLKYDRKSARAFKKEFDVASPKDVAITFGKKVKDGNKVYAPNKETK